MYRNQQANHIYVSILRALISIDRTQQHIQQHKEHNRAVTREMSAIRHQPLGPPEPGDSDDEYSDNEHSPLHNQDTYGGSQRTVLQETSGWDVFRDPPVKLDSGSMANQACQEISVKILKVVAYIIAFVVVLAGGVASKASMLFMTSQIRKDRALTYCNRDLGRDKHFVVVLPDEERIAWMWAILIAFAVPEVGALIRSVRICFFKSWRVPQKSHFVFVFVMETCHTVGLALLMYVVLPELDAVRGAMLTNCVCAVPGICGLLSRSAKEGRRAVKVLFDLMAISAQVTGLVIWPLLENRPSLWLIPVAVVLTSCGWWENFVCLHSPIGFVRAMGRVKEQMLVSRYFTSIFMTVWKIMLFFCALCVIMFVQGEEVAGLFNLFNDGFGPHKISVDEVTSSLLSQSQPDIVDASPIGDSVDINANQYTVYNVLTIQILGAYFCYITGKFACKIMIQGFSYAFPINLTTPLTVTLAIAACGIRNADPCFFHGYVPDYLFFTSPSVFNLGDFAAREMAWVWLLWLLSQAWITIHVWTPKCERLAATEKLFVSPTYTGLLIDQSMVLNRRRDDQADVKTEVRHNRRYITH